MSTQPNTPFVLPKWFHPSQLTEMRRGIEKEGLRIHSNGAAARTPHPTSLGAKLTHPFITTDYSENLLELITEPFDSIDGALEQLNELHQVVHQALSTADTDELMWPLSMPGVLSEDDADIPLADYGSSNIGKLKTLYRAGLGVRYGRKMQTIAGLHYNLSIGDALFTAWHQATGTTDDLPSFKNAGYLALIRNFKRLSPMVLYLTGASPSVSACFLTGRAHHLIALNTNDGTCAHTFYQPDATTLRMGKLGYTNSVQDGLDIRYNHLPEYIQGLRAAIATPFADFSTIGIDDETGTPIQINDHILQIENEYYSPIRPKQVTKSGETPTAALAARGIAYVEFRAIDLDPYEDIGIKKSTACFLEILALYCLLLPSPELLPDEEACINQNIDTIVNHGRQDGITLNCGGTSLDFHAWMMAHLAALEPIARALDDAHNDHAYRDALSYMRALANDSCLTPSAQIIADSLKLGSTLQLGLNLAKAHQASLTRTPLSTDKQAYYAALAETSWADQAHLEAADDVAFYDYIQPYRHPNVQHKPAPDNDNLGSTHLDNDGLSGDQPNHDQPSP